MIFMPPISELDHVREERSWQTSFGQLLLLPGPGPDQRNLDI